MIRSLPRTGAKKVGLYLGEIRRDDSSILELTSRQSLQRFASALIRFILDEDLADAVRLAATAAGAWDLHLDHLAVFLAFFLDVFADFWEMEGQY